MNTYRISQVKNLRKGDLIKITNKRVVSIEQINGQTAVTFNNGTVGVFFGTERVGIYR